MGYQRVKLGSAATLVAALSEGETNLFPLARVVDSLGAAVPGSPFTLTHTANGVYINNSFIPSQPGNYFATYSIYTDAGHTIFSTYPKNQTDYIEVALDSNFQSSEIVGTIQDDGDFITGLVDDNL